VAGSQETKARIGKLFKEGNGFFTYARLSDGEYRRFLEDIKKTSERIKPGQSRQREDNTVVIAAFPRFLEKARKGIRSDEATPK
jgi:hypothetical protein